MSRLIQLELSHRRLMDAKKGHANEWKLFMLQLLVSREKQKRIITCNLAATVQVPKPPPYTSQFNLKRRQQQHQRHEQEAQVGFRLKNDVKMYQHKEGISLMAIEKYA